MKKIIFLLLVCLIKLNAYEYVVYYVSSNNYERIFYDNSSGKLVMKYVTDGHIDSQNLGVGNVTFWACLNGMKKGYANYTNKVIFDSYLKNDLIFLNDMYIQALQQTLNYLYNDSVFSLNNHLLYENYEILYNDDGLAVESIVGGVWAGLYDDSQKIRSGALYDKSGTLVYYNGKEVTPVISFFVWLQKFTNKVVLEAFEEMQRSFVAGTIAAVVLVLAIVRLVLELLPSSITPRRRRYYGGGGRGRGSLSDYGDGSQVSASVRARLAAKNRALKARAYDRSGLEQSLQNSILFDLENSDR